MTEAQEYLLAFLKDWLAWAQGGEDCVGLTKYSPMFGLCGMVVTFCEGKEDGLRKETLVRKELTYRLKKDYGTEYICPFGGKETYNKEFYEATAHLNPARLAWVRKTIKELES